MLATRIVLSVVLLTGLVQTAAADEARRCLPAHERQAALATHRLARLAKVIRLVKARYGGEIVRVRLCEEGRQLVYVLTVLPRSGKVVQAAVDAASGAVIGGF